MNTLVLILLSFLSTKVYSNIETKRNHEYWESFGNLEKQFCNEGSRQSPINILKHKTIKAKFESMTFINYDIPVNATMLNNGHSIVLEINKTLDKHFPRISKGGLGGVYEIQKLQFHWGINYNEGSEHKISGRASPIELHMIHKRVRDNNSEKSSTDVNEFAVLSVMFQIREYQNLQLKSIIEGIHELKKVGINNTLVKLQLDTILPGNVEEFFRYEGSFTVPSCRETVIWTVFKEPVAISKYQLYLFKQFRYRNSTTRIMNNYRETQPLNGRLVFDVKTTDALD